MLSRILIANRGEIALRILRSCHEMGKEVVAAYCQVDKHLRHLALADKTICIGQDSYLQPIELITAAKVTGCDAIHPGYGLLSEDAQFARLAFENGLAFIGPSADLILKLGDKLLAREALAKYGLKPISGSKQRLFTPLEAVNAASAVGYPCLLKAVFGGGGRGIRRIDSKLELLAVFAEAQQEAKASFGQQDLYIEKYLHNARHIEVQILGDGKGEVVHLGSRDCSVQRRHQKLIEEAPAPAIDAAMLEQIACQAGRAMAGLNYKNAATVEFLYAAEEFYFMEVNPRIQVEHPVTEMLTGIDIVKAQIAIADTGKIPITQADVALRGCSIEVRINAESDKFHASPGKVTKYEPPGGFGVRVDSHLYAGYVVPHQYDSLLAKLIVWAPTRPEALAKMRCSLAEFRLEGIETSIPVLKRILADRCFERGEYNTQLVKVDVHEV
ncbi:MAG: ATP-grasp domain-containing protein [Pseudomonadales bacterium]|nr:ATP-grasp domain-containing protein [Pseudomonadales bacterium]